MTTSAENDTKKPKQAPDFYIFENGQNGEKGGKPAGAVYGHKKGKGFTILMNGKRYAAFPPKAKAEGQPAAQEGKGA